MVLSGPLGPSAKQRSRLCAERYYHTHQIDTGLNPVNDLNRLSERMVIQTLKRIGMSNAWPLSVASNTNALATRRIPPKNCSIRKSDGLLFVVETKSSLFDADLRGKESAKIKCGKAHFEALATGDNPASYIVARNIDDLMAKLV